MSRQHYSFLDLAALNQPYFEEMKSATARVITSGRYIGGVEVECFEKELADYVGVKYAVGVSNGLDALRLIFRAYIQLGRLKPGDIVATAANTYIATALAISDNGLRIKAIPACHSTNYNMDLSNVDDWSGIKALLPVHLYGGVCWDSRYDAAKENLLIIEDNAQAIGATTDDNRMTGALGSAAAFSFYPTKNIGAVGDAGCVTTNDRELAQAVKAIANYGSDRRYHNIYQGLNCRLDPLQAAILRVKLRHINEETSRRRAVANTYNRCLTHTAIIKPLNISGNVWHQYVVKCDGINRDKFRKYLIDNGVETDIHYPLPFAQQPCYAKSDIIISDKTDALTADLCDNILSLPIATTTPEEAEAISDIINRY